jgi:hypothetical protein
MGPNICNYFSPGLLALCRKGLWILGMIGFFGRFSFFRKFGGWTADVQPPGLKRGDERCIVFVGMGLGWEREGAFNSPPSLAASCGPACGTLQEKRQFQQSEGGCANRGLVFRGRWARSSCCARGRARSAAKAALRTGVCTLVLADCHHSHGFYGKGRLVDVDNMELMDIKDERDSRDASGFLGGVTELADGAGLAAWCTAGVSAEGGHRAALPLESGVQGGCIGRKRPLKAGKGRIRPPFLDAFIFSANGARARVPAGCQFQGNTRPLSRRISPYLGVSRSVSEIFGLFFSGCLGSTCGGNPTGNGQNGGD